MKPRGENMYFIQWTDLSGFKQHQTVVDLDEAYARVKRLSENKEVTVRLFHIHAEEMMGIDAEFHGQYVNDSE